MDAAHWLGAMARSERALLAQRWGLGTTVVPVMLERLRHPRTAQRVLRRWNELGVYTLVDLLAEHPGRWVPAQAPLRGEAELLRGWQVLLESEQGWSFPLDVALAMGRWGLTERLWSASLVARLDPGALAALEGEFGLPSMGSRVRRVGLVAARIAESANPAPEAPSLAAARLGALAGEEILAVRAVPGTHGQVFRLECRTGAALEVAPRELAERAGYRFAAVRVPEAIRLQPAVEGTRLRLPHWRPIAGVLTFSTAHAAQGAVAIEGLMEHVADRLSGNRVALAPTLPLPEAVALLASRGFVIESVGGEEVRVARR